MHQASVIESFALVEWRLMTISMFRDLAQFFMNFMDSLAAALLGQNHSPIMHCSLWWIQVASRRWDVLDSRRGGCWVKFLWRQGHAQWKQGDRSLSRFCLQNKSISRGTPAWQRFLYPPTQQQVSHEEAMSPGHVLRDSKEGLKQLQQQVDNIWWVFLLGDHHRQKTYAFTNESVGIQLHFCVLFTNDAMA